MSETVIDRRGSPLCVAPIERHEFVGSDFNCGFCHRPRAMHRTGDQPTLASNLDPKTARIRSPSFSLAMRTHVLTDRDIAKYEARGYYSQEFRDARRALWQSRAKRRSNFVSRGDRLIYCPG